MGYKEADMDESIAERDRVRSGVPFWTVPTGKKPGAFAATRIRILPPRDDHPSNTFYYWAAVHGNLPGSERPVLCPNRMFDETCPACVEANNLQRQGFKDDARELFPSWKALVNVVVLDDDGNIPDDAEPLVWSMPKGVMEDLISKIEELPKAQRNITSPKSGRDIIIRRKGKGAKDTKYEVHLGDAGEFDESDIFDAMHFLPDVYPKVAGVRITGLLTAAPPQLSDPFGDDDDTVTGDYREVGDDDESDDEPEPEPVVRRRRASTPPVESSPPPTTRRRAPARREEPEEDDDDGDDDDPEPDTESQDKVAAARARLQRALRGG